MGPSSARFPNQSWRLTETALGDIRLDELHSTIRPSFQESAVNHHLHSILARGRVADLHATAATGSGRSERRSLPAAVIARRVIAVCGLLAIAGCGRTAGPGAAPAPDNPPPTSTPAAASIRS